jgi:hypothetical protein
MGCCLTRLWRCKLPVVNRHGRLKTLYLQVFLSFSAVQIFIASFAAKL